MKPLGKWKTDDEIAKAKVSAPSRDRGLKRGISHKNKTSKTSQEKKLRRELSKKQSILHQMEMECDKPDRRQHLPHNYWRLNAEVKELEKRSDIAGFAKAVPFTDSKGVRQCELTDPTQASFVSEVVAIYEKRFASAPSRGAD